MRLRIASDRYRFVGTDSVLGIMEGLGCCPVMVLQPHSCIEDERGFIRQFIRPSRN
jgi:hypothetical protein